MAQNPANPNEPPSGRLAPGPQVTPKELEILKTKIKLDRNFDLSVYTPSYVQRRVNACLMRRSCSFQEYLKFLDTDPNEYNQFFDTLTINVTEFLRDPSLWQMLEAETFPQMIQQKLLSHGSQLRIWSAGCSSGEEPYSIAILMAEVLEKLQSQNLAAKKPAFYLRVQIMASDIDDRSLEKAAKAVYGRDNLKNISPERLQKYFHEEPNPKAAAFAQAVPAQAGMAFAPSPMLYRVKDEVRKMVTFEKRHFFNDKPFDQLDLILCRNAAIYLTPEMKGRLVGIFYDALLPSGLLIIGKSEMLFSRAGIKFSPVNLREHIFKKEPLSGGEIRNAV